MSARVFRAGDVVTICEDRSTAYAPNYRERSGHITRVLATGAVRVWSDDGAVKATFYTTGRRLAKGLMTTWMEPRPANPEYSPGARTARHQALLAAALGMNSD